MTVQAFLIFTSSQRDDAMALNTEEILVDPRLVDNPLADQLGEGVLQGKYVAPARILNDPDYTVYATVCSALPIRTMDSDTLFAPEIE